VFRNGRSGKREKLWTKRKRELEFEFEFEECENEELREIWWHEVNENDLWGKILNCVDSRHQT
jgi:hypothetical protein